VVHDVDAIVFLMGSDELDQNEPCVEIHRRYEPVLVASNVENDPIVANSVSRAE